MAGRKPKLTRRILEAIEKSLKNGAYVEPACRAAGIGVSTYYRWLEEGERDADDDRRTLKREFREAITRAQALAEVTAVQEISDAGKEDWRAKAWLLERRYSARWANTQKVKVLLERELEHLLDTLEAELDPDEFQKIAAVLARGAGFEEGEETL